MLFTLIGEDYMAFHVFLFLFVVFLLLCLVLLLRLCWLHLPPSHSRAGAGAARSPVCSSRAAQTIARPVVSPLPPPRERSQCLLLYALGARSKAGEEPPKRIDTEGFACPNRECLYFGITESQIHALVGDGRHGHAERLQTLRCQACHSTFSARRNTPLYCLKTPSSSVAMVLSALAEWLDPSAVERVFGFRHATITTWLSRAGEHAHTLPERSFCQLYLPHLQWDELRTRLRDATQVLWLWVAIDPGTKILPVLALGACIQHMAHRVIHSLRQLLAPGCLPLLTSDGLNLYFYALTAHFGHWLPVRLEDGMCADGRWQQA